MSPQTSPLRGRQDIQSGVGICSIPILRDTCAACDGYGAEEGSRLCRKSAPWVNRGDQSQLCLRRLGLSTDGCMIVSLF